jgi:predicted DsbA family dithiol-disulfide isomerase
LLQRAKSAEVEQRVRAATAQFHALQVTQRPTFVLDNGIGDRTVFSGTWRSEPLIAAVDSMLTDERSYAAWKAHIGDPPIT